MKSSSPASPGRDTVTTRPGPALVSVVFSFRNEAANLHELVARLEAVFAIERIEYELVFVNDASTDGSFDILLKEHQRNPRIRIVNLSRRFGVAEGVLAGMAVTSGDVVIYMDTDLQDPPELIPALLDRWRAGADVVHTIRTRRHGEHPLKMWATRLGYRAIQFGSMLELPVDAGDFKLLSQRVVRHLLRTRESDPYLRGLIASLGFTQAFVPYERQARHRGRTHFPFFSRGPWKAFIAGFTSFSFLPVYACGVLAVLAMVASLILLAAGGVLWLRESTWSLPLAAIGAVGVMWATTIGAIAVVGLYVIRIYKDIRRRPTYIVESTVGISDAHSPARHHGTRRRPLASLQR